MNPLKLKLDERAIALSLAGGPDAADTAKASSLSTQVEFLIPLASIQHEMERNFFLPYLLPDPLVLETDEQLNGPKLLLSSYYGGEPQQIIMDRQDKKETPALPLPLPTTISQGQQPPAIQARAAERTSTQSTKKTGQEKAKESSSSMDHMEVAFLADHHHHHQMQEPFAFTGRVQLGTVVSSGASDSISTTTNAPKQKFTPQPYAVELDPCTVSLLACSDGEAIEINKIRPSRKDEKKSYTKPVCAIMEVPDDSSQADTVKIANRSRHSPKQEQLNKSSNSNKKREKKQQPPNQLQSSIPEEVSASQVVPEQVQLSKTVTRDDHPLLDYNARSMVYDMFSTNVLMKGDGDDATQRHSDVPHATNVVSLGLASSTYTVSSVIVSYPSTTNTRTDTTNNTLPDIPDVAAYNRSIMTFDAFSTSLLLLRGGHHTKYIPALIVAETLEQRPTPASPVPTTIESPAPTTTEISVPDDDAVESTDNNRELPQVPATTESSAPTTTESPASTTTEISVPDDDAVENTDNNRELPQVPTTTESPAPTTTEISVSDDDAVESTDNHR